MALRDFLRTKHSEPEEKDATPDTRVFIGISDADRLAWVQRNGRVAPNAEIDAALLDDEPWLRRRLAEHLIEELRFSSMGGYYASLQNEPFRRVRENQLRDLLLDGTLPTFTVRGDAA